TMATTLLSLAMNKRILAKTAMTGELSLTGKVLPIGGLKEKVIAARRNKIRTIILPFQNKRDLDEIPEHITRGITFHIVERFEEVADIILQQNSN
ncbi:MAG: endopeptidase La, partial [Spirochaetales bacterium]|nr:endopeptidase La [Spirochaetales bacterium]